MEFLLLGPLEVGGEDGPIAIPAAKQRAVLAILLLAAGGTVPGWRLIEELWPEPPVSARKVVQTYVSKLRQVLPEGLLQTHQTGYALHAGRGEVDVTRFEDLVAGAGRHPPHQEAAMLREALASWRGPALQDFVDEPFARADIVRLEAMRLTAQERRIEIDLSLGQHDAVLAELGTLVGESPLNERLRGQLILALYRGGRQSDALGVYREGRRLLVDQLGVEPGPSLRRLEELVLRQDPELDVLPAALLPDASPPRDRGRPSAGEPSPTGGPRRASEVLFGRDDDLARIRQLVRDGGKRCLVLTGPAGIGKTRLAVEAAARLGPEFSGGWGLVDLTRVDDHTRVAAEVCSGLGVSADDAQGTAEALADALGSREQLLVLDNFEHLASAAPWVSTLVAAAGRLTVLVTSRSSLPGLDGLEYLVPPLELPAPNAGPETLAANPAVAMFLDRARLVRPDFGFTDFTAPTVAQLCARLDGLPLAIELAAARVDMLSPRAMLARLDDRLDLLSTDHDTQPVWHRSLRAAVDRSYQLLDPSTRAVFDDLAAFTGGFTLDTAATVVTSTDGRLLDAVARLRTASLVRADGAPGDEPRFTMLESIRAYAAGRLTASGRRELVMAAHARTYARLVEDAEPELRGPDQMRWLDLVQAELPNIRDAVEWCASHDDTDAAVGMMIGLWRFWQVRGLTRAARDRLEELMVLPDLSDAARAAGHLGIAQCAFHQGDYAAVHERVATCLPYYRGRDDFFAGFGLVLVGATTGRAGEDGGGALLAEALDLATRCRDQWLQAICRVYLGMTMSAQGRHQTATFTIEEALRGARELGDARMVAWSLVMLGRTALAAGDTARAGRRLEEALVWERRVRDAWGEAWVLQGLAAVALARRELTAALELAVSSLGPAQRANNRPAIAAALRLLATVAERRGEPLVAAQLLGAANVQPDEGRRFWMPETDGVPVVDLAALTLRHGVTTVEEHRARGRGLNADDAVALVTRTLTDESSSGT